VSRYIERKQMFLAMAEGLVESRAPEKILQLGFAIVRCDGHAVTKAEGLAGREVEIQLAEGKLKAEVKNL
jgi:exodeoxyribonuclease VII large subunit